METLLTIESGEFGKIEVKEEDIITFVQPILGFDEFRKFVLVEDKDFFPILWLQSIDESSLIFPIVNPGFINYKYDFDITCFNLDDINVNKKESVVIYTLLVIPSNKIEDASTNLRAPIIINPDERLAKQVVFQDDTHPVQFLLFKNKDSKED